MFVRCSDTHIGSAVRSGIYEPHVAAVVREVLHPGNTFVDVGANIGFFVALAASIVGPMGRVVAVEPMDKNIQLIAATIWRNKFNNVEIFPFAAAASAGIVPMLTNSMTSNGEVIPALRSEHTPDLFAVARPLDDLLHGLEAMDLLKLDIEGFEPLAWRGFARGLQKHRPMILSEFHPKCLRSNAGVEPLDYLDLLFQYGESVEVLLDVDRKSQCRTPGEVMAEWDAADRRLNSGGTTHLDLFVRPRSES